MVVSIFCSCQIRRGTLQKHVDFSEGTSQTFRMDIARKLERCLSQAREDQDILAVILFGSVARGEQTPTSDMDVCLVLQPGDYSSLTLSRKKLAYLKEGALDIHIFQQLPVYIRTRVLKEGKVLFARDADALYALAFRTAQAFADFKPIYFTYLSEVARESGHVSDCCKLRSSVSSMSATSLLLDSVWASQQTRTTCLKSWRLPDSCPLQ